MDAEIYSAVQRARINKRWKNRPHRESEKTRLAPLKAAAAKADRAKLLAEVMRAYTIIMEGMEAAGVRPPRHAAWERMKPPRGDKAGPRSEGQGYSETSESPGQIAQPLEPLTELTFWEKAKRRVGRERALDVPDGFWAKKHRLYLAGLEQVVEECEGEFMQMNRIVALTHLLKQTGALLMHKGEMAHKINAEAETALEMEVAGMSDEELSK